MTKIWRKSGYMTLSSINRFENFHSFWM